mgnify:CR=1 FL=1
MEGFDFWGILHKLLSCKHSVSVCLSLPPWADKMPFIRQIGRIVLCPSFAKEKAACEVCLQIEAGIHPDMGVFTPEGQGYTVSQAWQMQRFAGSSAIKGSRKVLIVERAEMLGRLATDALLKVFEEPAHGVRIFLLSPSSYALSPTLQSRCFRINVPARMLEEQTKGRVELPSIDTGASLIDFLKQTAEKQETRDLAVSSLCANILEGIARFGTRDPSRFYPWACRVGDLAVRLLNGDSPALQTEIGVLELFALQREIQSWALKSSFP